MGRRWVVASVCAFALAVIGLQGQQRTAHRAVFDFTSPDEDSWAALLGSVDNVARAFAKAEFHGAVIVHGQALGVFRKDSPAAEQLKRMAGAGIELLACENTMRRFKVTKQDLLPFVRTVDSGTAELIRRQEKGWAYIKATH